MSTFAKSFKDEVTRLARKEAKAAIAPSTRAMGLWIIRTAYSLPPGASEVARCRVTSSCEG